MRHPILFALSLALAGAFVATSADAAWAPHHPRRAEVNARLAHQSHRIMMERREGELTARQARLLHTEDRGIRAQEGFYASRHDGHISRAEQIRLNHEENAVSRQIGR
jgi:hypothetical protein